MKELQGRDYETQFWHESGHPVLAANPATERLMSTFYSLANGYLGLRGTLEEMPSNASPGFYVAGTYSAAPRRLVPIHPLDHILSHPEYARPEYHAGYEDYELATIPNLPNPVAVRLWVEGERIDLNQADVVTCERLMHLQEARVTRRLVFRDPQWRRTIVDAERFASWANRQLLCWRYEVTPDGHDAPLRVEPYLETAVTNDQDSKLFEIVEEHHEPGLNRVTVQLPKYGPVTISQAYQVRQQGQGLVLDVAVGVSEASPAEADRVAQESLAQGYEALRQAHLEAVRRTYLQSDVKIDADAFTQQGFNFGLMHLEMALPHDNPKTTVAVKGLTGEGYKFAILWDTEFLMFPYYLFTNPRQARNLLLYRYNGLDGARENARKNGCRGAQFPWEAARSGREECTPWLILPNREIHISADIAYAVKLYDDVTGDADFLVDYGAEIVFETARFFATRGTWNWEKDGGGAAPRYEYHDVGCPDQYHTTANNDLFINRMARWNLEYAVALAGDERLQGVREKIGLTDEEVAQLRTTAAKVYIPQPNEDGIIEEFDGFFGLSADLRGTSERFCEHTQAVKQPDVVLTFLPFPDEWPEEIQRRNWHFYNARTMHGSSLGMAGMAVAAARIGLTDQSHDFFVRATRADLDSVRPDTELGVHLASYGVLWEAVVLGYAGLYPGPQGLNFRPHMPRQWRTLSFALTWRGCRIKVELSHDRVRIATGADNPRDVPVSVHEGERKPLKPGRAYEFKW